MPNGTAPVFWLVAGADGVGKTTYARDHIQSYSGTKSFVNLDEIARGLSTFEPNAQRVRAARVSLNYLNSILNMPPPENGNHDNRKSISLETTLAGLTHLRTIKRAKDNGWKVHLLNFAVSLPEVALARIARRVGEGGHNIPEADTRRRFKRSLQNFGLYSAKCNLWRVSTIMRSPKWRQKAMALAVHSSIWKTRNYLQTSLKRFKLSHPALKTNPPQTPDYRAPSSAPGRRRWCVYQTPQNRLFHKI